MSETIISNDELERCYNDITAPSLTDSNYGKSLEDVFKNINNNFAIVANHDFIKGATGDSVKIESILFTETNSSIKTNYRDLAKQCIKNKYKTETESGDALPAQLGDIKDTDGNTITVWDNFDRDIDNRTAKLSMIYSIDLADDGVTQIKVPQSSLYYVFLDGRFANNKLSKIDESKFQNIVDASCILVYDGQTNDFKILDNAFPTIYYESGYGLCWKINGNASGIPVQGAPGRDGLDTKLFIVKSEDAPRKIGAEDTSKLYDVEIDSIFNGRDGYSDINSYLTENINEIVLGRTYSALIFCPKVNNSQQGDTNLKDKTDTAYNFYFGSIVIDTKQSNTETIEDSLEENESNESEYEVHGYFDTVNSIDITLQYEAVINAFKSINLANTEVGKLPGIFIPIDYEVKDDQLQATQKVHLLSATSISNNPNSDELNTDIIITPVNDINNLSVGGADNKNIKVEKYMYLKLNKDTVENALCYGGVHEDKIGEYDLSNLVDQNNSQLLKTIQEKLITGYEQLHGNEVKKVEGFKNSLIKFLEKYNYTLKYKLKQNVFNVNADVFKLIDINIYDPSVDISSGAMHLPVDMDGNKNTPNKADICFYTTDSVENNNKTKDYLGFDTPITDKVADDKYYLNANYTKLALPDSFSEKIVVNIDSNHPTPGIYQWVLDFNYDEFDATELVNSPASIGTDKLAYSAASTGKYKYDKNDNNIAACFNSVFTTTMSPNAETEILWFNGITINEVVTETTNDDGQKTSSSSQLYKYLISYDTIEGDANNPPSYVNHVHGYKWILYGWDYDCKNLFNFIKYVPIYVNDYSIDNDTVFNINYNVNITGDGLNKNKALTVHGNVNCEEIHSKSLEVTDQIKNIFTKDPTVSENSIVVGYSNSSGTEGKYNAGILENGTIIGDNAILKSVNAKSTKSDIVETGFLKVYSSTNINPSTANDNDETKYFSAKGSVTEGEIYAINTNKITLLRPRGPETYRTTDSYTSGEVVTFNDNKEILINSINNTNLTNSITFNKGLGVGSTGYNNDINSIIDSNYWDSTNTPITNPALKPKEKAVIDAANYQPVLTTTIPINSRNNTPIFVSNVGMESQQLCANGIAQNYCEIKEVTTSWTNTGNCYVPKEIKKFYTEHPACKTTISGTSLDWTKTDRKYICNPDFDTVKNFNSHRISLNDASRKVTKTEEAKDLLMPDNNNFNTYNSNAERKILYKEDNSFTYYKEYSKNNYSSTDYMHKCSCIKNSLTQNSQQTENGNGKKYAYNIFDDTTDMTLEINKNYNMLIGIYGETSYASNPCLLSGSYISIDLVCAGSGVGTVSFKLTDINLDSTMDYTSSAYKLYSDKTYSTDRYVKISSSSVGNYDWNWRYRSYYFRLGKYTISKTSEFFKKVSAWYNNGTEMSFYIRPSKTFFKVQATSGTWGREYVFTGLACTLPIPITGTDNLTLSKFTHKGYTVGDYDKSFKPKLKFKYNQISTETANVKSTTITENGIVCRDGNYTFGLGYSENVIDHKKDGYTISDSTKEWTANIKTGGGEPVLFYYYYDSAEGKGFYNNNSTLYKSDAYNNYVVVPKSGNNEPLGYARRMNFIPLKDIFEVIKHVRTTKGTWAEFGL
jgi:hypothetical protein